MLLHLTEIPTLALHEQIAGQIISKIVDDELRPGSNLLPARSLAGQQRISRKTVEKAYFDLQTNGFIYQDKNHDFVVAEISETQRQGLKRYRRLQNNIQSVGYLEALEKHQIEEELEMARKIQARLLPQLLPENTEFLMAASNESSRAVGGDFYDYLPIDKDHSAIVIADASGNGLPAALLIAQIQAILKSDIHNQVPLENTMQNLNTHLKQNVESRNFVTLIYGILNNKTGQFRYVNAGQNQPLLINQSGRINKLPVSGPALGLLATPDVVIEEYLLARNELFVLFTDGIVETMNITQEEYGDERLQNLCKQNRNLSPRRLVDSILNDLFNFSGQRYAQDDRTLFILKRK